MTETQNTAKIRILLWPTVALFIGLLLIYIGERAIGEPARWRWALDAGGGALVLAALLGRLGAMRAGDRNAARAETWMSAAYGVVLLGLAVYFIFATGRDHLREALGKGYDRADGLAGALWPILVLLGALPAIGMQLALQSMTDGAGQAEHVELNRVRYLARGGLAVGLVLIFCFAVNYIASERNTKYDLARFRSTRPSAATRKIVENLNKPMRATLFFPSANEVREYVVPYFEDLSKASQKFTYEVVDHDLDPEKAKDLGATGNGLVVIAVLDDKGKVTQKEMLHVGTTLENAGAALGTFDGDTQKRLLLLTRPGRIAYFTIGHGERTFDRFSGMDMNKDDLRAPISGLQQLLLSQGYEVKTLGVGQGLSTKVPGDAGIVFIPGPTERFLPEEVSALVTYLQGGGHVFLMLDPAAEKTAEDLAPLLKVAGIKYHPELLANEEVYWVRTHQPSDHINIAVTSFSSHPSMTTLSRATGRAAVVMPRSGWLERDGSPAGGAKLDFTIRSMPKTWVEKNDNFVHDPEEKSQVFDVAAAASKDLGGEKDNKKEMRLAVLASVDAASDAVLGNRANLVLVLDTTKWLMGDEAITADVAQEQDLPIVHTKAEDKAWFYLTVFAAPALILAGGLFYSRRSRRRRAS